MKASFLSLTVAVKREKLEFTPLTGLVKNKNAFLA